MSLNATAKRGGGLGSRLLLVVLAVLAVAVTGAAQTASGTEDVAVRPVIANPVASPLQPVAGERFTVSFKVTRSDTGAPLTRGTMICHPYVSGKALRHAESFKGGIARLAFVVPASAEGKLLKVKVTIKSGAQAATKVSTFKVQGATELPLITIGDASSVEGNSGTTALSFPVTLSTPATQAVSVGYATADGSAASPSDYSAASGTLMFAKGQKAKTIAVSVIGDTAIEPNETFTVTLSAPVNAGIARGTATGTITNDDTAVPVTVGNYKGATQNGNYVFFVVTGNRTITAFRINDIPCTCDGPLRLTGGDDFGDSTSPILADGSFVGIGKWDGSNVQGDAEWTHWDVKITGLFGTPTSATGTILENYELNYKGRHFKCTTGLITWSATLQG